MRGLEAKDKELELVCKHFLASEKCSIADGTLRVCVLMQFNYLSRFLSFYEYKVFQNYY